MSAFRSSRLHKALDVLDNQLVKLIRPPLCGCSPVQRPHHSPPARRYRRKARGRGTAHAGEELKPRRQAVCLLGRDIPVLRVEDGTLRADDEGEPTSARSVQTYIARAFGDRLTEARAAMEALAVSLPPEELNRIGFRLYARFRPDVPEGTRGWGAKGELRVERIAEAAG